MFSTGIANGSSHSLLSLPYEIRQEVLRSLLIHERPILVDDLARRDAREEAENAAQGIKQNDPTDSQLWKDKHSTTSDNVLLFPDVSGIHILQTCKQINDEGNLIFYGENMFRLESLNDLEYFARHMTANSRSCVKHLFVTEERVMDYDNHVINTIQSAPAQWPVFQSIPTIIQFPNLETFSIGFWSRNGLRALNPNKPQFSTAHSRARANVLNRLIGQLPRLKEIRLEPQHRWIDPQTGQPRGVNRQQTTVIFWSR